MGYNYTDQENQAFEIIKTVIFDGSGALDQGVGVCYDRDRGTATDPDESRDSHVNVPTIATNMAFAGVTVEAYAAKAGQVIRIYEPGSVCRVAIGADAVVQPNGAARLTCSCSVGDAGRFSYQGYPGRGSMIPLETNASGILANQDDGGTDAFDATGLILTAADTGTLAVADRIYVIAGENDGTNLVTPTVGPHPITALVADTTITIGTAQADAGTMEATWYGMSGNQTALAYLEDGAESGLQHWVSLANGANAATKFTLHGVTYIHGGFTPSADATHTLADGTWYGQRKTFIIKGALGTNDYLVTVTSGRQLGVVTALATFEMDATTDLITLDWMGNGDVWQVISMPTSIAVS